MIDESLARLAVVCDAAMDLVAVVADDDEDGNLVPFPGVRWPGEALRRLIAVKIEVPVARLMAVLVEQGAEVAFMIASRELADTYHRYESGVARHSELREALRLYRAALAHYQGDGDAKEEASGSSDPG